VEPRGHDWDLLQEALAAEGNAHRALLDGDDETAAARLREAADLYRQSWEAAGPRAFGRLVGMQKAAVIAGDGDDAAAYSRKALGGEGDSPASWYAIGIGAVVVGEDELAQRAADGMRDGSPPFVRAADAIDALARADRSAYGTAVRSIVEDFEGRDEHLTGVPIADTALMLERIAAERGMAVSPESELLPRAAV
jgi:hypothetical protein